MPDPGAEVSSATSAPRFEPDEGWVPADERLFGLDRRTLRPTLAVFALVFIMSVVLPVINATVPYHDIVRAGDVMEIEGDVTFVPEAGWGITSGVRAGPRPDIRSVPRLGHRRARRAEVHACAPGRSAATPTNCSIRSRQPPRRSTKVAESTSPARPPPSSPRRASRARPCESPDRTPEA